VRRRLSIQRGCLRRVRRARRESVFSRRAPPIPDFAGYSMRLNKDLGEGWSLGPVVLSADFNLAVHSTFAEVYPPLAACLVAGEDELTGVDAGFRFGNTAVVDLDLLGRASEDDAGGDAGLAGDAQAAGFG
jgi:hypothetical protein